MDMWLVYAAHATIYGLVDRKHSIF
jgi:hypothetical protein